MAHNFLSLSLSLSPCAASSTQSTPAAVNIAIITGSIFLIGFLCLYIIRRMRSRRRAANLPKTPTFEDGKYTLDTMGAPRTHPRQHQHQQYTTSGSSSTGAKAAHASGKYHQGHGNPDNASFVSHVSDVDSLLSMASYTSSTVEFDVDARAMTGGGPLRGGGGGGGRARPVSIDEGNEDSAEYESASSYAAHPRKLFAEFPPSPATSSSVLSSPSLSVRASAESVMEFRPMLASLRRSTFTESELSDVSSASRLSELDEYDLVDPGSLRNAGSRTTQALVQEGRFRTFSTDSGVVGHRSSSQRMRRHASSNSGKRTLRLHDDDDDDDSLREMEL